MLSELFRTFWKLFSMCGPGPGFNETVDVIWASEHVSSCQSTYHMFQELKKSGSWYWEIEGFYRRIKIFYLASTCSFYIFMVRFTQKTEKGKLLI